MSPLSLPQMPNAKYCGSCPTTLNNVTLVWVLYSVFPLDTHKEQSHIYIILQVWVMYKNRKNLSAAATK